MKIYKKALAWLVCLTMLLSMSTGVVFAADAEAVPEAAGTDNAVEQQLDIAADDAGQSVDAEEPESEEPEVEALAEGEVTGGSLEIVAGGETKTITASEIKSAASVTATEDAPWTNSKGYMFVGTFYSLKSILETAGVSYSDAHGLKAVASDGFTNGFTQAEIDSIYIYDQGEVTQDGSVVGAAGTYGAAINGADIAGNKWAKSVATIEVVSTHIYFVKNGKASTYCSICGDEILEDGEGLYTLQELITKTSEGETATLSRDVTYKSDVTIDAGGKTVTLDLNGKTLTANKLIVKNGTVKLTGGTLKADMEGNIKAIGGMYTIEVPSEMCGEGMVPVYDSEANLYEVKAVSAYDSQKTANELEKTIKTLEAQIAQLSAKIEVGSATVTVKAAATDYDEVTLTWEADQHVDGFSVEKKVDDVWIAITPDADGKYVDTTEPGIANEYRVAAYAEYGTNQKEFGKYVTATAKTSLGKAAVSSLTSKSKKLTVKWKSVSGASAYDVYVGTNSAVTKGLVKYTNVKSVSKVTKALKKGKTYYVKVRARVANSQGNTVYGAWSTAKKIKCK